MSRILKDPVDGDLGSEINGRAPAFRLVRMNLHLVRHGETAYNRDGLCLGRADVPLTDLGWRQAKAVVVRLVEEHPARILASPLVRAAAIAEELADHTGAPLMLREELIEMDVGNTEGLTFLAMAERFPEFIRRWRESNPSDVSMPGGESLRDVAVRLDPLIKELLSASDQPGDVVLVSHNFVLRLLVCRLLGLELASFRFFSTDLASVSTFVLRDGRTTVVSLNDVCHVPE